MPGKLLDGIKEIFVPDTGYIDSKLNSFVNEMAMKFSFDTDFFENLFQSEQPVEDVDGNYVIPGVGDFKLKFLDTSFFVDGVTYFRPFIRGFLVLLMMLYNIKQLVGFFGYNAGVVAGRSDGIDESRKSQRG